MSTTAATPKERPILFTGPLVREILAGRKTQTRRIVKLRKGQEIDNGAVFSAKDPFKMVWPYGQPGDRLWVRETWSPDHAAFYPHFPIVYRADCPVHTEGGKVYSPESDEWFPFRWRPSIHMPRWACRIELEVTAVRIERLQSISGEDAIAEGFGDEINPCYAFAVKWDEINGNGSWDASPFVWVIEFRRFVAGD